MPVFVKDNIKILFIHIPKAGGSSIEAAFREAGFFMHFHDHGPKKINSINPFMKCSPQHFHAEQINSVFNLNSFDEIFTVVRHPEKRFLSEFAMRHANLIGPTSKDLNNFQKECLETYQKNSFIYDNHIRPQNEFIVPNTKVFKLEDGMENIQEYFKRTHNIDLEIGRKLDSSKFKIGESSKIIMDNNKKLELEKFYSEDFDRFNYDREKKSVNNESSINFALAIRNYIKYLELDGNISEDKEIKQLTMLIIDSDYKISSYHIGRLCDLILQNILIKNITNCNIIKEHFNLLLQEDLKKDKLPMLVKYMFTIKNRNKNLYEKIIVCLKEDTLGNDKIQNLNVELYFKLIFRDGYINKISNNIIEDLLSSSESVLSAIFYSQNKKNQSYLLSLYKNENYKKLFVKNKDLLNIYNVINFKDKKYHNIKMQLKNINPNENMLFYKKLKIAICISGQLRGYEEAYESWKESGLIHENTAIFLSTWDEVGSKKATPGHCDRIFNGTFVELYKDLCIGRNYENVLSSFKNLSQELNKDSVVNKEKIRSFYQASAIQIQKESELDIEFKNNHERMYYKIEDAFSLIEDLSKFDLVIRIRPDKYIKTIKNINWKIIKEICDSGGVFTDMENVPNINPLVGIIVGDQFAIASPEKMKIYSETYSLFKNKLRLPMRGHNSLAKNLLTNNILTYCVPVESMGRLIPPKQYDDYEVCKLLEKYDNNIFKKDEIKKINLFINKFKEKEE